MLIDDSGFITSMTICQALAWATQKLTLRQAQGLRKSTSADLDAEVILSHVLQKPREWLLANPKSEARNPKPFDSTQGRQIQNSKFEKFQTLILQRVRGIPVAYLTNKKEFYGLDFYVDERVLIPRPETEMLVLKTVEMLGSCGVRGVNIVDIGTGSGCIAIALAKTLVTSYQLPVTIYATDISTDALTVARKNAKKHKVKINFLHGDLLEPLIRRKIKPDIPDIIVANLPYLKPSQIKSDIQYEPRKALDGGEDGLKYYEQLLRQIKENLLFINYYLLFEIDPSQVKKITELIHKYLPSSHIEIKKDLAGRERVVAVDMQVCKFHNLNV